MYTELDKVFSQITANYQSGEQWSSAAAFAYGFANLMTGIGVSISLIMLAYAFIQYLTAEGDIKAIDKAHSAVKWSIIALFISMLAGGLAMATVYLFTGGGTGGANYDGGGGRQVTNWCYEMRCSPVCATGTKCVRGVCGGGGCVTGPPIDNAAGLGDGDGNGEDNTNWCNERFCNPICNSGRKCVQNHCVPRTGCTPGSAEPE